MIGGNWANKDSDVQVSLCWAGRHRDPHWLWGKGVEQGVALD